MNIIYKSLESDREQADITDIIQDIHRIVDEAIQPTERSGVEDPPPYDISQIDFERLRREYEQQNGGVHNAIQNLRDAIEKCLQKMIAENPLRTDFQTHYEELIQKYNREKDRQIIEQTFEELLKFVAELDHEAERAIREGLDEETLAIYDLLKKPELIVKESKQVKEAAKGLLEHLKAEKRKINRWPEKQTTRDTVQSEILDFLWSDQTDLPEPDYSEDEVEERAKVVFLHVLRRYGNARPSLNA